MLKYLSCPRLYVLVLAAVLLTLSSQSSAAQAPASFFYYYQGARVPLTLNPARIVVRFVPGVSEAARRAVAQQTDDVDGFDAHAVESPLELALLPVRAGHDPLAAIQKFKQHSEVQAAGPVFKFDDGAQYAESGEFIVRFRADLSPAAIATFNSANGVEVARTQPYSKNVLILRPQRGNPRSALDLANAYVESHQVEFAEPDFAIIQPPPPTQKIAAAPGANLVPNDPDLARQWYLRNTGQFQGSQAGADIKATAAWGVTQGATQVTIAIIDEGVDAFHPDLESQVLIGRNFTTVPDNSQTQPSGSDHHGTATAGIAAAITNNGVGMAGVCWYCRILPIKVAYERADGSWFTYTSWLASGIDWAWQNGANVLSNSWTMSGPSDDVTLSIINAYSFGSTLVFAAGNQNVGTVSFPASLSQYVIAVGASNWCDQRKDKVNSGCNSNDQQWGSNYGSGLDLVAPGEQVYTTCNGSNCNYGDYTYFSGTSASTPIVAGVAGLLYSLNPNLSPQQVQSALQRGAQDLAPAGKDNQSGYGRVDTYGAIEALFNTAVSVSHPPALFYPGDVVPFTIAYSNTGITDMSSTVLTVTLPSGLGYIGSNPVLNPVSGSVYQLNVGLLPNNQQRAVTLSVQVQPGTDGKTLVLNAQIAGQFPELDMSDNTATDSIAVAATKTFLPFLLR